MQFGKSRTAGNSALQPHVPRAVKGSSRTGAVRGTGSSGGSSHGLQPLFCGRPCPGSQASVASSGRALPCAGLSCRPAPGTVRAVPAVPRLRHCPLPRTWVAAQQKPPDPQPREVCARRTCWMGRLGLAEPQPPFASPSPAAGFLAALTFQSHPTANPDSSCLQM